MNQAADFEAHLAREIVESERLRMAILAALFAVLMALFPLMAWIFYEGYAGILPSRRTVGIAMLVAACIVAYELGARHVLGVMLRRGRKPPTALRFLNAFVETSVPSLFMILVARELDPVMVLQGPAVLLYGVFIILSTLRLDFALSIFTGLVAAAEYAALALLVYPGGEAYGVLAAPGFIAGKALVLFVSGVAAGFVAATLRRRIRRSLRMLQERERIVSAFGQQVSPAVAEEILRQGTQPGGRKSFVCVMFMDIRDFTRQVEHSSPEEIVAFQNRVFGVAVEVVNRHRGVINQFLGDGFMATFGAPVATGEECRDALAAARELVSRIDTRIGIGLHADDAVSGNVGSEERKQYSITGNVVILASRIEQLNKQFGSRILISREVLTRCGATDAVALGAVAIKGRDEPMEIFRIA